MMTGPDTDTKVHLAVMLQRLGNIAPEVGLEDIDPTADLRDEVATAPCSAWTM